MLVPMLSLDDIYLRWAVLVLWGRRPSTASITLFCWSLTFFQNVFLVGGLPCRKRLGRMDTMGLHGGEEEGFHDMFPSHRKPVSCIFPSGFPDLGPEKPQSIFLSPVAARGSGFSQEEFVLWRILGKLLLLLVVEVEVVVAASRMVTTS
jgi:hypothetical protein